MIFDSLSAQRLLQRKQVHEICRQFGKTPSKGNLRRLKSLFAHCGEAVFIEQGFYCDYGDPISLGDRVYINANCTFLDGASICIGDDCLVGPNVQLITINHATTPKARLNKLCYAEAITIGDNVWIGAGAIILPGVTVGNGVVVGAGSIVTASLQENHLYAGNPARKIRALE